MFNLKTTRMYNILIATGRVLINIPTKDLAIADGSYLIGKYLDKKKIKTAKNLAK